jgi:hypothetical protein
MPSNMKDSGTQWIPYEIKNHLENEWAREKLLGSCGINEHS